MVVITGLYRESYGPVAVYAAAGAGYLSSEGRFFKFCKNNKKNKKCIKNVLQNKEKPYYTMDKEQERRWQDVYMGKRQCIYACIDTVSE